MTSISMRRGLCLVAFAAALASSAPQASGQTSESHGKRGAATAVTSNQTTNADDKAEGCPGTQYPQLKCEAIAAQAGLEQARQALRQANQSARQGDLFRTEILISALTMIAAFAAAAFAARAATAARATVNAFTEVERADVFVTLENVRQGTEGGTHNAATGTMEGAVPCLHFDLVANNLGRSAALLTNVGATWTKSKELKSVGGFFPDVQVRIVSAATSILLKSNITVKVSELKKKPYLWVLIKTQAPLVGQRTRRFGFEVYEHPMTTHKVTHQQIYYDELHQSIPQSEARQWWTFWKHPAWEA